MSKLTPCKTCGHQIAKTTKACPSCGAKHKPPTSAIAWTALILLFAVGLAGLFSEPIPEADRMAMEAERQAKQADQAIERARRDKKNNAFAYCGQILKQSLRDPSSLKWDRAGTNETLTADGWRVIRSYSADNAFGGRAPGVITCQFDQDNNLIDHAIVER